MADGLAQALATLATLFDVHVLPGGSPVEFTAQLIPPPSAIGRDGSLMIDDVETITQLVASAIDLSWLTKSVRFKDLDITHADVIGGMPVKDLLGLNLADVTVGDLPPKAPGVPGLLGAIKGSVQIPMDVIQSIPLPVQLSARWAIKDEQGAVVANDELSWTINGQLGTGGNILVNAGAALKLLTLTLRLLFIEQVDLNPPIVKRWIQASIQLQAGPASSGWIDLPAREFPAPAVAVPTVLMCFKNTGFTDPDSALVMVPANSPFDKDTLLPALDALKNALSPFQGVVGTLGFILQEIDASIKPALNALNASRLAFQKADSISDLSNIEWNDDWFGDEVEDEISSLIMIAAPRRQAQCFNGRNLNGAAEGEMDVTVGLELLVEISDLHSSNPASNPPSRVSVPFPPTGWRWPHSISIFGDELSSIRFTWA